MNKLSLKNIAERPGFSRLAVRFVAVAVSFTIIALGLLLPLALTGLLGETLRTALQGSVLFIILTALLPLLASAAAGLIIAWYTSGRINSQRSEISDIVSDIQAGNYDAESIDLIDPDNESIYRQLGAISEHISGLSDQNEQLRQNYDQLNSKVGGLQFNLLTAKSSPAMVCRIMTAIEQMAKDGKSDDIARLSANANAVFKSALIDSTQRLPLADELALIKSYLEINEQLGGDEITYRISIMCNIVDVYTIPNLILPVVANFVEYAERGTALGKYEVSVEVANQHDNLVIAIRDNGTGISHENLERIRAELSSDDFEDSEDVISLSNINRRIGIYYGAQYGLKISSSRLGTIVRLYLPKHMETVE